MNRNELIEKINYIFDKYNRLSKKPKLWKLDTAIIGTWERLYENITSKCIDITKIDHIVLRRNDNDKGDERYDVLVDNKIVTPTKNGGPWSRSGVRQMIQEGAGFDIFPVDENIKIEDGSIFNVSIKFQYFINENAEWKKKIYTKVVEHSFTTGVSYVLNFGFSFFFTMIFLYDKTIFNDIDLYEFINRTSRKNGVKSFSSRNQNTIALISSGNGLEYTYGTACKLINKIYSFEKFIDNVWFFCSSLHEMNEENNTTNISTKIRNERQKLAKNIASARGEGMNDVWDLVSIDTNEPFKTCVQNMEAAHIYNVYQIKREALSLNKNIFNFDTLLNKILLQASDPNNGLMLRSEMHKAFDRQLIKFDTNGRMLFIDDNDKLKKDLNIPPSGLMIKKSIFNDQMKKYLEKR